MPLLQLPRLLLLLLLLPLLQLQRLNLGQALLLQTLPPLLRLRGPVGLASRPHEQSPRSVPALPGPVEQSPSGV